MTSRTLTASAAVLFVAGVGVFGSRAAGQPARQDPVLQELRMLRQTIDGDLVFQMQIQLAGQRANASQMRVSALAIELANARSEIGQVAAEIARTEAAVKRMEAVVPPGTTINLTMPIGEQYYLMKAQVETEQQRQGQLQLRETQIVALISAEQARLDAANRRLDELERALTSRR